MDRFFQATVLCTTLTCSTSTYAGGPLVLSGPAGNTPVTYQNHTITLDVENGKLGSRNNAEADALLQNALAMWNYVDTSDINLIFDDTDPRITKNINENNFEDFLPSLDGSQFKSDDGLNPIVYDDGGEIIDAYFGDGQSDFTIGFAASILTVGSLFFNEGYAVINGKKINVNGIPRDLSDSEFILLIAHEIGHFFGLDHSQADISNQESNACLSIDTKYPVMYPFACRDDNSLHTDDISAVTALYSKNLTPNADFSVLNGHLTDMSGKAILGANIWAKNMTGEIYSIISDYLKQGNGFYELLLPPGNYTLHANSINTEFNGGSSIGPYALSPNGASFKCPHPITLADYEGNTPGIEVITIAANQTTEVEFSLSQVDIGVCPPPVVNLSSGGGSSGTLSINSLSMLFLLLCGRLIAYRVRLLN